jgi:uncharacterized protein (TIGR03435 family)
VPSANTWVRWVNENAFAFIRQARDKSGLEGTYLFLPKYCAGELISVLDTEYGIKLLSKKGPVDTLVVDKIERPSGN